MGFKRLFGRSGFILKNRDYPHQLKKKIPIEHAVSFLVSKFSNSISLVLALVNKVVRTVGQTLTKFHQTLDLYFLSEIHFGNFTKKKSKMKVKKNEKLRLREQTNIVTSPTKRIGGRMKVRD